MPYVQLVSRITQFTDANMSAKGYKWRVQPCSCHWLSVSDPKTIDYTKMENSSMMSMEGVVMQMREADRRFQRACRQLVLLNNHLEDLNTKYRRCKRNNMRGLRYGVRLQLSTVEGLRNMFYEYACQRADELEEMQQCLVEAGLVEPPYDE